MVVVIFVGVVVEEGDVADVVAVVAVVTVVVVPCGKVVVVLVTGDAFIETIKSIGFSVSVPVTVNMPSALAIVFAANVF